MQPTPSKRLYFYAAPILSGILLGLSQPLVIEAFGSTPLDSTGLSGLLALIAYVPVILVAQNASVKQAFFLGFLTTLVQYLIIIHWLVIAMTVFGNVSLLISTSVLTLTCGIIACYLGSAFALSQYLHRHLNWSFLWTLPAAICAVEYLRNFGFVGGFPWGTPGYSLATIPLLLQGAALVGIYGLVFYVVLVNSALAAILGRGVKQKRSLLLVTFASTLVILIYGAWRLHSYDASSLKTVKVALLQGNIEQGIKNKAAIYSDAILQKYRRLQSEAAVQKADISIWPEASFPLRVPNQSPSLISLGDATPASIVGAVAFDDNGGNYTHFNTAFVLDPEYTIVGRFDKNHLVPFGEYVPWPFASIVQKVVPGLGSFGRGGSFKPVDVKLPQSREVSLGVTICYEGVFPEISRAFANNGAEVLVNLTNDAWYGVSSAPYQHLRMYSMRAVETGRAYARSTNTGVSAWVDARGYVHDTTPLYQDAVVMADIPLSNERTPYLWLGDFIAQLSLLIVVVAWVIGLVGKNVLTRRRSLTEWLLGLGGFALVAWSYLHFAEAKINLDESASTKDTLVTGFGLLLGSAALAGRPWGRKALLWAGAITTLVCALVAYAEGLIYLCGSVVGLVVFLFALLRPSAYHVKQ